MIQVRKPSNVVSIDRAGRKSGKAEEKKSTPSPFAIQSPDPLKQITERKSSPFTEEQQLELLHRAFSPFAEEVAKHLPGDLRNMEKKVRDQMLKKGFSKAHAQEAGDEAITAVLKKRSHKEEEES